jgi:hypothetical protein
VPDAEYSSTLCPGLDRREWQCIGTHLRSSEARSGISDAGRDTQERCKADELTASDQPLLELIGHRRKQRVIAALNHQNL